MEPINILFAENQFLIREGVIATLKKAGNYKIHIVETKADFLTQIQTTAIDLVIMDNIFIENNCAIKLSDLKRLYPQLKFLLLTNGMTHTEIAEFSNSGINNIITKTSDKDDFCKAIEYTMKDKIYYSNELLEILIEHNNIKSTPIKSSKLTPTEKEIVKLLVQGLSSRDIALKQFISYHTVVSHKKNIFKKLGVNTTSELIIHAMRNGFVDSVEYTI